MLNQIEKRLIVSCQALPGEPLEGSNIMAKMAFAAYQGGAAGIRANSKEDIIAIKETVNLPVVGIVKRDYPDSEVFITATKQEIDELLQSRCEMIALDATKRSRPNGETLEELVQYVKNKSDVQLMADISSVEEAEIAQKLGFDCISTTLYGYTNETKNRKLYEDDFRFLSLVLKTVSIPVIAEGNVLTPEMAKRVLELGAYSVVVGGAITRPQQITKRFTDLIG